MKIYYLIIKLIGRLINGELLEYGYLYIGEFDEVGPLCIDLKAEDESKMKVIHIDFEDWCNCESREDIEETQWILFNNFKELLDCFILGKVQSADMLIDKN